MGSILSTFNIFNKQDDEKYLGYDLLEDNKDFVIFIDIYSVKSYSEKDIKDILEYIQYTKPATSYMNNGNIRLLFNTKENGYFLRSNIASEVIAYISSELSIWLTKNNKPDPRMINVKIKYMNYNKALLELLEYISDNNYKGSIYGVQNLDEHIYQELM